MENNIWLQPGDLLSVTAVDAGNLVRLANQPGGGANISSEAVSAAGSTSVGPFQIATRWQFPSDWSYSVSAATKLYGEGVNTLDEDPVMDGASFDAEAVPRTLRVRHTIAEVNAGQTLVAAPGAGLALRLIDAWAISVGGAAGAVTTIDINGTQGSSSVKLVAFAQASLTQSSVLKAGGTGAAVLADGASFVQNDANTAIAVDITGDDITTATHVDILLTYVIEEV